MASTEENESLVSWYTRKAPALATVSPLAPAGDFLVTVSADFIAKNRGTIDVSRTIHALRQAADYLSAGDGTDAARMAVEALARMAVAAARRA